MLTRLVILDFVVEKDLIAFIRVWNCNSEFSEVDTVLRSTYYEVTPRRESSEKSHGSA